MVTPLTIYVVLRVAMAAVPAHRVQLTDSLTNTKNSGITRLRTNVVSGPGVASYSLG